MNYYDERGVSRHYQVSIKGNVLKWWRDSAGLSQHNVLTMSGDGQTMTGNGELSRDGLKWGQDLNLTYTKI